MIELFSALAEPTRFRIVELLRDGPRSVNDIGARLALSQPQASKHLRVLREAHLVETEPRAQQRIYGLRGETLRGLLGWLEQYRSLWETRFQALDGVLQELEAGQGVGPGHPTTRPGRTRASTSPRRPSHERRRSHGSH